MYRPWACACQKATGKSAGRMSIVRGSFPVDVGCILLGCSCVRGCSCRGSGWSSGGGTSCWRNRRRWRCRSISRPSSVCPSTRPSIRVTRRLPRPRGIGCLKGIKEWGTSQVDDDGSVLAGLRSMWVRVGFWWGRDGRQLYQVVRVVCVVCLLFHVGKGLGLVGGWEIERICGWVCLVENNFILFGVGFYY